MFLRARLAGRSLHSRFSGLSALTEHWEGVGQGEVGPLAYGDACQVERGSPSQMNAPQGAIRFGVGGLAPLTDGVALVSASRQRLFTSCPSAISKRRTGQGGTVVLATAVQSREQVHQLVRARSCDCHWRMPIEAICRISWQA